MYRFNNLAGRLVKDAPTLGRGLKPAGAEEPAIVYGQTVRFPKVSKSMQTATKTDYVPLSPKMLAEYKKFQAPNDIPVHLKGGPMDKVFIYVMAAGMIVTGGLTLKELYPMAFPKKAPRE